MKKLEQTARRLLGRIGWVQAWRVRRWEKRHLGARMTASGTTVPVDSFADWIIYREIFEQNIYARPIDDLLAGASQNLSLIVVDLGANVGYFILRLMDAMRAQGLPVSSCRVVAVEGMPATFATLRERITAAGLLPQVSARFGLVGERDGSALMASGTEHFASKVDENSDAGVTVDYVDLDALLRDTGRIDLLKCDIEGAEEAFAKNYAGLLGRTDRLCIEIHGDSRRDVCLPLLRAAGLEKIELLHEDGTGDERRWVYFLRRA